MARSCDCFLMYLFSQDIYYCQIYLSTRCCGAQFGHIVLCCAVLCYVVLSRQQRELADVELSRLSAEVQASAAAAADAQGLLAAAETTAHRAVEAARCAQLKVGGRAVFGAGGGGGGAAARATQLVFVSHRLCI